MLTIFRISDKKVRQLGEISKDNGTSWQVEYDLTYKKGKLINSQAAAPSLIKNQIAQILKTVK